MRTTLPMILVLVCCACGGTGKSTTDNTTSQRARSQYSSTKYITGIGVASAPADGSDLVMSARNRAKTEIAHYLWSEIKSTLSSTSIETNDRFAEELRIKIESKTTLDPKLNALITEANEFRDCNAQQCTVFMVLKRSEASLLYRKDVADALAILRQHVQAGFKTNIDLFNFAGSVNSAQAAYAQVINAQYRLKAIDKSSGLGLTTTDNAQWQKLVQLKAKRLANLSITVKPARTFEWIADTEISGVKPKNGFLKDAGLGRSVGEAIVQSLSQAQVRAALGRSCSTGLLIEPASVLTCGTNQGFTQCTLEITGTVKACTGQGTTKRFTIRDSKKLRGIAEENEYSVLKPRLQKALKSAAVKGIITEQLGGLLPVAISPQR